MPQRFFPPKKYKNPSKNILCSDFLFFWGIFVFFRVKYKHFIILKLIGGKTAIKVRKNQIKKFMGGLTAD